jgi:Zn-dependent peptidase ImmA (M78 family)
MKKLGLIVVLLALGLPWAAPAQSSGHGHDPLEDVFEEIQATLAELEEISGMKALRKVEFDRIGRDNIRQFLEEQIKAHAKPEEIQLEELVLKKFGFVPEDFNLAATTVDLLTEQAAAFYDYRRKKLYIIDSAPEEIFQMALVHELAHALADQHYSLEKFVQGGQKNDDSTMARMAVMEGQATWLMAEYMARQMGLSLKNVPTFSEYIRQQAEESARQYPVFNEAPLYMRETMLFPYTQGIVFQQAVVKELGPEAFRRIFQRPPVSTQQVLHPEKYLSQVLPLRPALPELKARRNYRELAHGALGELDHSILLRQYTDEEAAAEVSPEWRGAEYRLLEGRKEKHQVLVYASVWSTPETASRFFDLYRRVLQGKSKDVEIASESPNLISGRIAGAFFFLRRNGSQVSAVEGLRSLEEADLPELR